MGKTIGQRVTHKVGWFLFALGGLLISMGSLVLPIITYVDEYGRSVAFNIVDILTMNPEFYYYVMYQYNGPGYTDFYSYKVIALAGIAIVSLLITIIGLITLRTQRPNTVNCTVTILGFIGITIPDFFVMNLVFNLRYYYPGILGMGIAPIIAPIASLISIGAVLRGHKVGKRNRNYNGAGIFKPGENDLR